MQLVMRRERLEAARWYNFKINARMVIDPEETELLERYKLHNVILTEGDMWRDVKRALLLAVPIALVFGFGVSRVFFFIVLPIASYMIYQQIREEVRVNDLLTGRDFKARSFLSLLQKEHAIRKMSDIFATVVAQSKTWQEPEVITLNPQPLITIMENNREAA
jgi:hypothetical protein